MNDQEAPKAATVTLRADTVHLIDHVQPNKQQSCVKNLVATAQYRLTNGTLSVTINYTLASVLYVNKSLT